MKPVSDEDLVLLYYGEHDDPGLAARVAADPELSVRFDRLCAELAPADDYIPPERDPDYGADVWMRLSPQLAPSAETGRKRHESWLAGLLQPRFSLAGAAALVLVAALAFQLGRHEGRTESPVPPLELAATQDGSEAGRLLTSSVSGHLDQLNLVFTQFVNTSNGFEPDGEYLTQMLVNNRLYRQLARSGGDERLAAFLGELEPLLVELAHEAYKASPETRDRMQNELRESLLLRVRVMNQQLKPRNLST